MLICNLPLTWEEMGLCLKATNLPAHQETRGTLALNKLNQYLLFPSCGVCSLDPTVEAQKIEYFQPEFVHSFVIWEPPYVQGNASV